MFFEGKGPATKSDEFSEKCQMGEGGVIFNPKTYVVDFGNFKQGFLSMKLIQNSNFRALDMFFSTIVLRNIAKGTTDPRVEFILPKSYHKFKRKS